MAARSARGARGFSHPQLLAAACSSTSGTADPTNQVIDSRDRRCLNQKVHARNEEFATPGTWARAEFGRQWWKKIRESRRAVGEQQTAAVLGRLGAGWYSLHDVPHSRGNWDHICVGPAGVFVLETENVSRPAIVSDDTLRSGRTTYRGVRFRRAAMELRDEIGSRGGRCPYVHAVVVLWGEFAQRVCDEKGVRYVAGDELLEWLCLRPAELSESQVASLRAVVSAIAADRARASAPGALAVDATL
jgi:Nuclease-related domain